VLGGLGVDRLISRQPWETLVPHLLKARVSPEATIERLRRYARQLIEWNRGISNLISRRDEERIVERHLAESIAPAAWLRASPATRWLDFGSGAGLPAIPLAITGVGPRWTLVESRRMKTLFLRKATEVLKLEHFEIVVARLEHLVPEPERKGAYDGFTSRATLALGPTLALAAHFVAPGGTAFLWKGSQREKEMSEDPRWAESWEFDGLLGIGDAQTVVARFTRKP
jgi:16S rRNA (guanine527-N7)-methyltransferase